MLEKIEVVEKGKLKAGTEIGVISDITRSTFNALNAKRAEAWRELQAIREEERDLWAQIESDFELSDECSYNISPVTGKVQVSRRLSKSEVERERRAKKELEEEGGEE